MMGAVREYSLTKKRLRQPETHVVKALRHHVREYSLTKKRLRLWVQDEALTPLRGATPECGSCSRRLAPWATIFRPTGSAFDAACQKCRNSRTPAGWLAEAGLEARPT